MRLIDIEPFEKNGDAEIHFEYSDTTGCCQSVETKDIPTVEPKKGNWIIAKGSSKAWVNVTCSECGKKLNFADDGNTPNFCPNCGVKMVIREDRMTIDEIKEEMCDHHCRFVYKCKSQEELEEKYCSKCPLNWLEDD